MVLISQMQVVSIIYMAEEIGDQNSYSWARKIETRQYRNFAGFALKEETAFIKQRDIYTLAEY